VARPHPAPPAVVARGAGERRYVGRSVVLSVALHLLAVAAIWWLGLTTLKNFFAESASLPQTGPAAEQPIAMELLSDASPQATAPPASSVPPIPLPTPEPAIPLPAPTLVTPHPPVPHADLLQHTVTASIVPNPSPIPPTKPAKPGAKPRPPFMAQHATGEGKNANISPARVGSPGFPAPGYPAEALALHEGGTVGMEVVFGADGSVASAEIRQSSGYSILDVSTRRFIEANWKSTEWANTTIHIPIIYAPEDRTARAFP
jgi:TonB family protein